MARNFGPGISLHTETISRLREQLEAALHAKTKGGAETRPASAGRYIPPEGFDALWSACQDGKPAGVRDRAMFAVAYETGMRVHEVAKLQMADIEQVPQGYEITVVGKGDRLREISPVVEYGAKSLSDWLALRGDSPGACFSEIGRNGNIVITEKGISCFSLERILARRADAAGIPRDKNGRTITFHDFRKTRITDIIRDAGQVYANKFIGHKTIAQTSAYDRSPIEAVRSAVHGVAVPPSLSLQKEER